MQGLHVGAFVKGEMHLSWMQMLPSPFMPFILIYLFSFSFNKIIRGHFPGMVTMLPTRTFKEMRRLGHDETPFLLAMPPGATTLAW
jgi:hypothetical protein